jgi:small subunit ribosomal protein S6
LLAIILLQAESTRRCALTMAKISENYEAVAVFSSKAGEDTVKTLTEKFDALIKANATDVEIYDWGKRKLAYPINYENEGNYVLWNFTSGTAFPAELERVLGITDGVLRFLVTIR